MLFLLRYEAKSEQLSSHLNPISLNTYSLTTHSLFTSPTLSHRRQSRWPLGTATATASFQMACSHIIIIPPYLLGNTKACVNVWQSKGLIGPSAGKEFLVPAVKEGVNSSPPPDTEILFPC